MKTLCLTRKQALELAGDLKEYSELVDSHQRYLFKGFKVRFGDTLEKDIQPSEAFEVTPMPELLEIAADDD